MHEGPLREAQRLPTRALSIGFDSYVVKGQSTNRESYPRKSKYRREIV